MDGWKSVWVTPDATGEKVEWQYRVVGGKLKIRRKGYALTTVLSIVNPYDDSEHFGKAVAYAVDNS